MNVLSLFSGIGGFDLGLARAGSFNIVAMCDNNPDRRADLARLFPGVKVYDDVITCSAERLAADGIPRIDVICGGFPCQDISVANPNAKGLAGARSGLWFEYARLIEEIKPAWIIIENSPRLRHLGLETILRFLDTQRYDAFWDGIPANAVGAYHERDRLFIVASRDSLRELQPQGAVQDIGRRVGDGSKSVDAPDSYGARLAFWQGFRSHLGEELAAIKRDNMRHGPDGEPQPGMVGTVYDVPATLDRSGKISKRDRAIWKSRIHALGNSMVPCIATAIGRSIISVDIDNARN